MNARTIRRAQERKAAKLARKAELSEAQLVANRANAQLSTGPTSETGKVISSLNAVKTGLTGRTVLLPSDDAELYRCHIAAYEAEYKPVGLRECELVQSLADTRWRLNRISGLEMAIYAQGHIEFEAEFAEHPSHLRSNMVEEPALLSVAKLKRELQTHVKYEKQLRNLQLQEARLLRRYQKEMSELRELQEKRSAEAAVLSEPNSLQRKTPGDGFEFSTSPATPANVPVCTPSQTIPVQSLSPHIDCFALPSFPCGNFQAPAHVD